mgnify:CR=1 FL=1
MSAAPPIGACSGRRPTNTELRLQSDDIKAQRRLLREQEGLPCGPSKGTHGRRDRVPNAEVRGGGEVPPRHLDAMSDASMGTPASSACTATPGQDSTAHVEDVASPDVGTVTTRRPKKKMEPKVNRFTFLSAPIEEGGASDGPADSGAHGSHAGGPPVGASSSALIKRCARQVSNQGQGSLFDTAARKCAKQRAAKSQPYDYYLVLDVEATCEEHEKDFPNEIIEFPVVLVDSCLRQVVDTFHSYVKPRKRPTLTRFCTELTGIQQPQVDQAPHLETVLERFEAWLDSWLSPTPPVAAETASSHVAGPHDADPVVVVGTKGGDETTASTSGTSPAAPMSRAVFATDGPWDLRHFLHKCHVDRDGLVLRRPELYGQWINLRKTYSSFFKTRNLNLGQMLTRCGMDFIGRPHSGIDDARNIARIVLVLMERGCVLSSVTKIVDEKAAAAGGEFGRIAREIEAEVAADAAAERRTAGGVDHRRRRPARE